MLDSDSVEKRVRKQITLSPVKTGDTKITKREALRLLQPHLDRATSGATVSHKAITFDAFSEIWERDYLSLQKPATQSAMRSYLKRLRAAFGSRDMRSISAGDVQRLIARSTAEGLAPKTIRLMWGAISQIWQAAHTQQYVGAVLSKPKLPRNPKKKARFFTLSEVVNILTTSDGEHRAFYWLMAETGLRAGEVAGLRLSDVDTDRLTVNQSVWHGKEQTVLHPLAETRWKPVNWGHFSVFRSYFIDQQSPSSGKCGNPEGISKACGSGGKPVFGFPPLPSAPSLSRAWLACSNSSGVR